MKKTAIMFKCQWYLTWVIFVGILAVNLSRLSAGNISATDKYAWTENAGWINFSSTHGSVTVYSTYIEGYVWAENIGWVRLGDSTGGPYNNTSSSDWGVNNDGSGNLSGYAWSENAGWINFNPTHSQVTINTTTGSFDGYAWGENIGWIHFNNTSPAYNVVTTWTLSSGGGGGGWEPPAVTLSISSTSPSSGATGVSVTTAVSATFNMYVNGSTVTTETFTLGRENGDVEGYVVTNGATITFTPSLSLLYGTQYTGTVTTKVAAANWAGTTMESAYSWSFTTENEIPVTPTPAASPTPTPEASPAPTPAISPTPSPVVSPTPETTPGPLPTATQLPTPSPMPTVTSLPTLPPRPSLPPMPTPTIVISPTPAPTATPVECASESMSLSPDNLKIRKGRTKEVIVTVTGSDGCLVEGDVVAVKIEKNSKRYISVSPKNTTTDASGQARFEIKAKRKKGTASVAFMCEEMEETVTVNVIK